jgi:hypothetical protein
MRWAAALEAYEYMAKYRTNLVCAHLSTLQLRWNRIQIFECGVVLAHEDCMNNQRKHVEASDRSLTSRAMVSELFCCLGCHPIEKFNVLVRVESETTNYSLRALKFK